MDELVGGEAGSGERSRALSLGRGVVKADGKQAHSKLYVNSSLNSSFCISPAAFFPAFTAAHEVAAQVEQ